MKIYKCNMCGNVLEAINDKCDNLTCCNTPMKELKAFEVEGAKEKHIPVYTLEDDKIVVSVGEVLHPMDEDHYIEFITYECCKCQNVHFLILVKELFTLIVINMVYGKVMLNNERCC